MNEQSDELATWRETHVREFAKRHRLRTERTLDGVLVLPLGPKRSTAWTWYAGEGMWRLYVLDESPFHRTRLGWIVEQLRDAGAAWVRELDVEIDAAVRECDFLRVLGGIRSVRLRRKRVISPSQRAALIARIHGAESGLTQTEDGAGRSPPGPRVEPADPMTRAKEAVPDAFGRRAA